MSEEISTQTSAEVHEPGGKPANYEEFEIGENKVPWFLWLFFILIIAWASVSWIKFFGY
jgi:hypothetical protein